MQNGGPSITARRVAAHRLGFTRVPAAYGDRAADETLAADVAAGREAPASRMHDYLAARTSFFDRIVVAAIGRGVRQIVVGGAGYDGRALRYAKPGVRWFEVDHPATQRDKRGRLERLGIAAPQVRFVAADFTKDPVGPATAMPPGWCPWSCGRTANLDGMRRWGYVTIDGTAMKIHKGHPGPDAVLRATPRGLRARRIWRPLPGLIEQRWLERSGAAAMARLDAASELLDGRHWIVLDDR